MSLDYHVILDPDSGTFFGASDAMLIDIRQLSQEELDTFNDGTDGDRAEIGRKYGRYVDELNVPDCFLTTTFS